MKLALRIFSVGFPFSTAICIASFLGWDGIAVYVGGFVTGIISLVMFLVADGLGHDRPENHYSYMGHGNDE